MPYASTYDPDLRVRCPGSEGLKDSGLVNYLLSLFQPTQAQSRWISLLSAQDFSGLVVSLVLPISPYKPSLTICRRIAQVCSELVMRLASFLVLSKLSLSNSQRLE